MNFGKYNIFFHRGFGVWILLDLWLVFDFSFLLWNYRNSFLMHKLVHKTQSFVGLVESFPTPVIWDLSEGHAAHDDLLWLVKMFFLDVIRQWLSASEGSVATLNQTFQIFIEPKFRLLQIRASTFVYFLVTLKSSFAFVVDFTSTTDSIRERLCPWPPSVFFLVLQASFYELGSLQFCFHHLIFWSSCLRLHFLSLILDSLNCWASALPLLTDTHSTTILRRWLGLLQNFLELSSVL